MKPILFEKDETVFASNGLGRLQDCISCTVTEERNGIFECDFEYPVDGRDFNLIQCGRIIGVTHDDSGLIQPFDIVSYTKPISGVVSFHAVHISYRQSGMVATGTNINSLADAFAMLEDAEPENPFTYEADFTSTAYMASADGVPRSVRQYLGGIEGSILDAYGGEYEFDKFNVILHQHRGHMRDFAIRYGVNMLDFKDDTDFSETYTSAIPYWKGNDNGTDAIVIGDRVNMVDTSYNGRTICAALDLSDKFENKPTKVQLQTMAQSLMNSRQTNLPHTNISANFVRLQDLGYQDLDSLLKCRLCDTITVIFPSYNMSGSFQIVKVVWDALADKYDSMELGALSTSLADALGISNSLGGSSSGGGGGGGGVAYIVENGITGDWYWRKWSDGTAEAWAIISQSVTSWTQWGSMYYSNPYTSYNYPTGLFIAEPVIQVSAQGPSGNNADSFSVGMNNGGSASATPRLFATRPASGATGTWKFRIYAIGQCDAGSMTPNVEITQQGDILSMI